MNTVNKISEVVPVSRRPIEMKLFCFLGRSLNQVKMVKRHRPEIKGIATVSFVNVSKLIENTISTIFEIVACASSSLVTKKVIVKYKMEIL